MKKITLITLVLGCFLWAAESQFFLGMKMSKYGFAGIEFNEKWGFAIENSIFVEYVEFQYARFDVFYRFNAPFNIDGFYALYTGMRYNRDYFDVGGIFHLQKNFIKRITIGGTFQPSYDSDIKRQIGYSGDVQLRILSESGLVAGVKNIAEYRQNEQRFYGGLFFDVSRLCVRPEISVPTKLKMSATRVSVSFLYKNFI